MECDNVHFRTDFYTMRVCDRPSKICKNIF